MQFKKVNEGAILRLEKGEEIVSSIVKFCDENNLQSGFFHGLGAVMNLELGYYFQDRKEYNWKIFNQVSEIDSLTGNIALVEGRHFVHVHGVFSTDSFQCFGGHVKSAIVGATCEIYLIDFKTSLSRTMDDEIGLKLIDCEID